MNISETTSESISRELDNLVDRLEAEKKEGSLKLMNDTLFGFDADMCPEELPDNFDIGEPEKKKEENVTFV